MSSVVKMLDGKLPLLPPVVKREVENPDLRFKAFDMLLHDNEPQVSTHLADSQGLRSISTHRPWMDTSLYKDESHEMKLLPDLYDVDM
ncbi:unnamed protein product [Lactuca virosa]|uniref:Uncharacterized protein n=1 Tax=Lactuca virosa TaxID=75947 RepID=A0AAU9PKC3_9ASTR|nr:unnamed protein product [Lactuca virosa]